MNGVDVRQHELIERLHGYGLVTKRIWAGDGAYIEVTGVINKKPFRFVDKISVRVADDHTPYIEALYTFLLK